MEPKQKTDESSTIVCGTHGAQQSAIVCGHLVRATDMVLGFVEDSSDPDDPLAWCNECEKVFVREQELTEAFRGFSGLTVVCVACYAQLKEQHSTLAGDPVP